MATLEELKQQHHSIIELIEVLSVLIREASLCETSVVNELFQRMIDQLENHLNDKDKTFSAFLTHDSEKIRNDAKNFLSGAKMIHGIFNKYRRQWRLHEERCSKHDAFVKESEEFFSFMKKHINEEEEKCAKLIEEASV
jgi:hemerythrin